MYSIQLVNLRGEIIHSYLKSALERRGLNFICATPSEDDFENEYFQKPDFNSVFHFENEAYIATLIYQPVIYSDKAGMTGLYRSSNKAINRNQLNLFSIRNVKTENCCYTPDYYLSIENRNTGKRRVMLFDAKNKSSTDVANADIYEIIFKYQLSLKKVENSFDFVGIDIICGSYQGATCLSPFCNIRNPVDHSICEDFVGIQTFSIDSQDCMQIHLRDSLFSD